MKNIEFSRIGETIYALVENENIVEIKILPIDVASYIKIGQIYCGRIKTIDMRLSAAFVEIDGAQVFLPFIGARPKYLIEGRAIQVEITRVPFNDKLAYCKYIGDAKPNEPCPSLIKDVENWGNWPMPNAASNDEVENIKTILDETQSPYIGLKNGGNIAIETTRAMTNIDIDAGGRIAGGTNQNNFNHKLNLEAANEICRQIRLRNICGLIMIDFVGAPQKFEAQALYDALKQGLKNAGKCEILPISKFGVCEIARARNGNSLVDYFTEKNIQTNDRTIAINAINMLAEKLEKAKGQELILDICARGFNFLENWKFDYKSYLQNKIGGKYKIISNIENGFEIK